MKNRANRILELLVERKKMETSELAKLLGVSKVTMRKDLDDLESKRIIKREHGFAVLCSIDDINGRIAYHYEAKKHIAKKATELVADGDTIMIENGSCCALFADALTACKKDLTIITSSAYIASYIRGKSNFQIVILGGIYQQDSQVMVGPMVRQCVENFFVKYLFIGVDGYSSRVGFTDSEQMRAQAVRDMSRQAEQLVVLTESEKLTHHGVVPLNLKYPVSKVITDANINADALADLQDKGVEVILA